MTVTYPLLHPGPAPKTGDETNAAWGRRTDDHLGTFKQMLEQHLLEKKIRSENRIEQGDLLNFTKSGIGETGK
jgi:hypothetical protein